MSMFDRLVMLSLALGVWALVAVLLVRPATGDTASAPLPMQNIFNGYLSTALAQARSAANGCHIRGQIRGSQLDAQVSC